jgi:hypothetical protein
VTAAPQCGKSGIGTVSEIVGFPAKRGQIYFPTVHKIRSFAVEFSLERSEGLRMGCRSTGPVGAIHGSINKSVPFSFTVPKWYHQSVIPNIRIGELQK